MGLSQAIARLTPDRTTENVIRETLELFRIHPGQPLTEADVASRLERPEHLVSVILSALTDCFVLHHEGSEYVYEHDSVTDLEIDRFMHRAGTHSALVQSNLAKFRDRYGFR